MKLKHLIIAAGIALPCLLAGCASADRAPAVYEFGPMSAAPDRASMATSPTSLPMVLVVADATGPSWLDKRAMVYRLLYANAQQSYPYAAHRWSSSPLQLLSARLKSRIAEAGMAVLPVTDASSDALILRIEVDDFSQHFQSEHASSVCIKLRASLFRGRSLIKQKTLMQQTKAGSANAIGGARALAASSDSVAYALIAWLTALPLPVPVP